jgi:hypothetical protein
LDSKIAISVGAAAALATTPCLAAPSAEEPAVPPAASYAELLQPIPNAVERLARSNAEIAARPPVLVEAQYVAPDQEHHHHHHHHHSNDWYRQNGYTWSGSAWVIRPQSHHHHHHSRSWYQRNGYYWYNGAWVLRPQDHHHHHHNNY